MTDPARPPVVALGDSRPYQVGIVVPELDAASGPPAPRCAGDVWQLWTYDENTLRERRYRGSSGTFSMRIALGGSDPQLELIQPLQGPSIYHEYLAEHVRPPSHGVQGSRHRDDDRRDGAGRLPLLQAATASARTSRAPSRISTPSLRSGSSRRRSNRRSRAGIRRRHSRERRFDRLRDEPERSDGVEIREGTRLVRAEAVAGLQQRGSRPAPSRRSSSRCREP